eukprot:31494-Pelagococcus_subviridis.AAC.19
MAHQRSSRHSAAALSLKSIVTRRPAVTRVNVTESMSASLNATDKHLPPHGGDPGDAGGRVARVAAAAAAPPP